MFKTLTDKIRRDDDYPARAWELGVLRRVLDGKLYRRAAERVSRGEDERRGVCAAAGPPPVRPLQPLPSGGGGFRGAAVLRGAFSDLGVRRCGGARLTAGAGEGIPPGAGDDRCGDHGFGGVGGDPGARPARSRVLRADADRIPDAGMAARCAGHAAARDRKVQGSACRACRPWI